MLSNFVRGKAFVVIVLIALFIGLGFFGDYGAPSGATGTDNCFIKVYGDCYRKKEAEQMAEYYLLANRLFLVDFARSLFGENRLDGDPTDFVMSLIVLRREAEKLGIEPSAEEIAAAVPGLPIFRIQTNLDGEMIKNNLLAPRGLTTGDFEQLVKDYLTWQRIQDLLEAGLRVPGSQIDKQYLSQYQQFVASLAEFDRAGFEEKVEVTDDDIQQYFEANKEDLLSDEKRGFVAVTFFPPEETEEMTNEEKAKLPQEFGKRVGTVYEDLAETPAEFESIAKAAKESLEAEEGKKPVARIEVADLEPFSQFSPPEAFEDQFKLLDEIFSRVITTERPVSISPEPLEDGSIVVLKLTEVVPPKPLTLEEAKDQIKTALKAQKSNQLVNEAASAAAGKIAEALEAGQSIEEAAKAAEVELKPLDPFSQEKPPTGIKNPGAIVNAAIATAPQSVSSIFPRPEGDGYQFLVVDRIELVESEDEDMRRRMLENVARGQYRRALFRAWFDEVKKASGAERSQPIDVEGPEPSIPAGF